MPITTLYTTVLLPTGPLPDCILLFYYHDSHYQTVYCGLLPTCPIADCILLVCYEQANYNERSNNERQTEEEMGRWHQEMDGNRVWRFPEGSGRQGRMERYCCNVISGAPTTSKVKGQRWDERYHCSATKRPITRLYTTVLLPTCPLPDLILLLCYQ